MWNKFSTKLYKWASDNQAITTSSWYTFYTPKTLLNINRPWRPVPRTQPLTPPPWSMRSPKRNQLWTSSLLWFNQDKKRHAEIWKMIMDHFQQHPTITLIPDTPTPHPASTEALKNQLRLHHCCPNLIRLQNTMFQQYSRSTHHTTTTTPFYPWWQQRCHNGGRDEWRQDETNGDKTRRRQLVKKKLSRWETRRMEMRRDENKMRQLVKKKIVTMGDETNGDKTRRMETRRMETKRMETRRIETRRMETRRMETRRKELRGLSSDDVERDSANHDAATCDDSDRDEESRCDICLDNMTKDDSAKIIFMIN